MFIQLKVCFFKRLIK